MALARRISILAVALTALVMTVGTSAASAAGCTTVTTSRGTYTAAAVDTPVTGTLDASGCQIGAYYDTSGLGVFNADISGASYYGVFVDTGASVDVTDSTISNIGETPFNGAQHGWGVFYADGASGTVDSNTIFLYQKSGIVVDGTGTSATVTNNTVTGNGPVPYIAQNGIEVLDGATGTVSGNAISGDYYTGCSNKDAAKTGCVPYVAVGLLLYDVNPSQVSRSHNLYRDDQRNEYVGPSAEVTAHS